MYARRKIVIAVAGALVAGSAGGTVMATKAAGAQGGRVVYAYGTPALNGGSGTVIVTGAIGDYGSSVSADASGQPDPNGAYSELILQAGTILSYNRDLGNKIQIGSARAQVNPVSCSLEGSVSAPATIISGTGAYAGITGTLDVTFTFAELAARTSTGACDLNAEPPDQFATITAFGPVNLPGWN